ncbi:MAG: type IX secretion system sortase PorU, partial [Bacteroidales bacterium]|nr:type IX secretion system sortase PorU [Bacteroidales bacterium]
YRNKAIAQGSDIVPKYLLLFGSPSYDYRNRTGNAQNFVLNYQFPTGLREAHSFSTDDMFGFLADGDTGVPSPGNTSRLTISIGRFPARTLEQARTLVDKTISYAGPRFGDWRNMVTNLADDGDSGLFVKVFESTYNSRVYFENDFRKNFREINIDKIYFDAFPQVATPSGARFPAAKEALIRRIERGTLILNYQGHSGPVRLADEDILNVSDIQNLENIDQLTVFFTASCNFSQYDDPDRISGGEWSVISPKGGAVAQIGASRVAWASPNDTLHGLFNHLALMRDNNGNTRSLGECLRLTKNASNNLHSLQQFVLLGDPAISLALPKYRVITTHINDTPIENGIDTVRALDYASISGKIVDFNNNFLSDFNGEVNITVFDKPTQIQTLGQKNSTSSHNNPVIVYEVQENVLFRGSRIPVINGEFNVQFMTPKDINYNYGFGKISYYAYSDSVDATGVFDSVVIGGFGEFFGDSADPPLVRLFLNDTNFRNGNIATSNPILLAKVSDKYGINFSGAGIGHNISLVINDDFRGQIYLNDFFEELPRGPNGEMHGEIHYPMFNLLPGAYNLKLKVWNVFNISTEASLDFNVVQSDKPIIGKAFCFPNPMIDHTKFYFTHNAPKKIKRVEVDIFDMSGRFMVRLSKNVSPDGFAIEPIEWDTRDANGHKLRQGLYLYRLRIVLEDGRMAEKTEKLVIGGG